MPGRTLPLATNHYYHIYNRSIELKPIFTNKKEYQRFYDLLNYYRFSAPPVSFSTLNRLNQEKRNKLLTAFKKKAKVLIEIICFCLMPNHFHFLLKQKKDEGISQFLGNLQNSYARYFNLKYKRIGSLFQGRFKAVLIETEGQLLHLSRYIHLNPYSSAIIKTLDQLPFYQWSSLPQYLGNQQGICQTKIIMSSFLNAQKYKKFLFDRANYQKKLEQMKHLLLEPRGSIPK